MKGYHIYFYFLKIIILIIFAMMSLKIIPINNNFTLIIDSIFKFSIGFFIIIFFLNKKIDNFNNHDKVIIILSGFMLILLIDYIKLINIIKNNTTSS
jgi:hypothetical protein